MPRSTAHSRLSQTRFGVRTSRGSGKREQPPAVAKHISGREDAGPVWRTREAQRKPVHLDAAALERLTAWIDRYRLEAEERFRRLDILLESMAKSENEKEE